MAFKFQNFLDTHNIQYVESGPNVAKGHVNIQCPFCGVRDPSQHLGINLSNNKWGCWRDQKHRGNYPERLVMELIRCSWDVASEITGRGAAPDLGTFDAAIASLKSEPEKPKTKYATKLKFPKEFRSIERTGFTKRFYQYLRNKRGFNSPFATRDIVCKYDLRCALTGEFSDRIIIPVYRDRIILTSWTGRTLFNDSELKYQALDSERSVYNIKDSILDLVSYWSEAIDTLFIVEGPFDAMKLDHYGRDYYCSAVCLFGSTLSDEQSYQINFLVEQSIHKRVIIMMDDIDLSMKVQNLLGFSVEVRGVPFGVKDPGDLSGKQVREFCSGLRR